MPSGSSPLARGLRSSPPRLDRCRRIIPARAGFTAAAGPSLPPWPDHPRSRGVYGDHPRAPRRAAGSSPLARGLRRPCGGRGLRTRIIPARAGFTAAPSRGWFGCRDHPRSRGVYMSRKPMAPGRAGSSPLARGLRRPCGGRGLRTRIIPARAGFTAAPSRGWFGCRDHPRSRGVYMSRKPMAPGRAGSSPLARGLLVRADPPA